RQKVYQPPAPAEDRIFQALMKNLFQPNGGDVETFLTCRAVSPTKFFDTFTPERVNAIETIIHKQADALLYNEVLRTRDVF
ncbi:MAG: hypothetical protein IKH50_10200, partial [Oscillospiraceae bacterium]|nr:hypothetical protein [Oscillospiraceae bacterium]